MGFFYAVFLFPLLYESKCRNKIDSVLGSRKQWI